MFKKCLAKQEEIKSLFFSLDHSEKKYEKIIELGQSLPTFDPSLRTEEHLVAGCQSALYIHSRLEQGNIFFNASSDSLISAGLAALLFLVYNGDTPETLIKCPPTYLEDIGIYAALSPNRSNGLWHIHLRMQQEAIKFLLIKN